jgi:hypothetical protein
MSAVKANVAPLTEHLLVMGSRGSHGLARDKTSRGRLRTLESSRLAPRSGNVSRRAPTGKMMRRGAGCCATPSTTVSGCRHRSRNWQLAEHGDCGLQLVQAPFPDSASPGRQSRRTRIAAPHSAELKNGVDARLRCCVVRAYIDAQRAQASHGENRQCAR